MRFFIVKDAQGRTVKTYGVNQDITERKRAEEAKRQAEENFRHSLDESPLGARIVTAEGKTIYANKAILDLYGLDSLEEMNATSLKDRYTPRAYAEHQDRKQQRLRGGPRPDTRSASSGKTARYAFFRSSARKCCGAAASIIRPSTSISPLAKPRRIRFKRPFNA